jgi:hypothetical protein
VIEMTKGDIFLQVSVNDSGTGKGREGVDISWIYFRPAREEIDNLCNPNRELGQSKYIEEESFKELKQIRELEGPFEDALDVEKVRGDRMLHWLMRDSLVGFAKTE